MTSMTKLGATMSVFLAAAASFGIYAAHQGYETIASEALRRRDYSATTCEVVRYESPRPDCYNLYVHLQLYPDVQARVQEHFKDLKECTWTDPGYARVNASFKCYADTGFVRVFIKQGRRREAPWAEPLMAGCVFALSFAVVIAVWLVVRLINER